MDLRQPPIDYVMPRKSKQKASKRKHPVTPTAHNPRPAVEVVGAMETRRPFRSKLVPHYDQIRQWRRERKTYIEMAALFLEKYGMKVHPDTINAFVLVRARRKAPAELPDPAPSQVAAPDALHQAAVKITPKPATRLKQGEIQPYEPANPSDL